MFVFIGFNRHNVFALTHSRSATSLAAKVWYSVAFPASFGEECSIALTSTTLYDTFSAIDVERLEMNELNPNS